MWKNFLSLQIRGFHSRVQFSLFPQFASFWRVNDILPFLSFSIGMIYFRTLCEQWWPGASYLSQSLILLWSHSFTYKESGMPYSERLIRQGIKKILCNFRPYLGVYWLEDRFKMTWVREEYKFSMLERFFSSVLR